MKIEEVAASDYYTIYCDMDGVIADFAKGVKRIFPEFVEGATEKNRKMDARMWAAISAYQKEGGQFWLELDPMPDAHLLWEYIKPHGPHILSAAGQPQFGAAQQKLQWLQRHFPLAANKIHITQTAAQKATFANPRAILIDDKRKALDPFEAAGGNGVWHHNAVGSIALLKQLGIV